jgi:UDP-N-acetylglucosamine--N-acetylmuramyl-(pentapeptide) pyrophosphoryl-undecaprenol N-acetylglucosamine transferase
MTALLVATSGGHLRQLHELRPRLPGAEHAVWFTLDTPQSRSLLAGEEVVHGTIVEPRAVLGNLRSAAQAHKLLSSRRFDLAVSTGASLAVATLPQAALRGIPSHFIESATRVTGPSLSGRLLRRVPGIHLYCQYPAWANPPWNYRGSIFDGYRVEEYEEGNVERVLVTVGMSENFGFRSLVEKVLAIVPPDVDVIWQTGSTDVEGLGIEPRASMLSEEFDAALASADVVVAHAGTGSSIAALGAGKIPVLVPRRATRGEHVDEHQQQIAAELDGRGLALHREVEDLTFVDLQRAARLRSLRDDTPPPFHLLD